MKADYSLNTDELYVCGALCKCGIVIYLKHEELTPPMTIIKCPKCGFIIQLFTKGGN